MRSMLLVWACVAFVGGAVADEAIPCVPFDEDAQRAARDFWTVRRKADAIPIGLPSERNVAPKRFFTLYDAVTRQRQKAALALVTRVGVVDTPNTDDPPFNVAGRLFLVDVNGGTKEYCTASFTKFRNVLLTAAHCVQPSVPVNKFLFSRVFGSGHAEDFDIVAVAINDHWTKLPEPDKFQYDYAFLRTKHALSFAVNVTPLKMVSTIESDCVGIGYPFGVNLGLEMHSVDGGCAADAGTGMVLMESNPMGEGASGGPLMPGPTSSIGDSVFSIGSMFGPFGDSILGPVLDDEAHTILAGLEKCAIE